MIVGTVVLVSPTTTKKDWTKSASAYFLLISASTYFLLIFDFPQYMPKGTLNCWPEISQDRKRKKGMTSKTLFYKHSRILAILTSNEQQCVLAVNKPCFIMWQSSSWVATKTALAWLGLMIVWGGWYLWGRGGTLWGPTHRQESHRLLASNLVIIYEMGVWPLTPVAEAIIFSFFIKIPLFHRQWDCAQWNKV